MEARRAFLRHFVVDSTHAVVELLCPEFLVGKTLMESQLRAKHGLNLVTVRRSESQDHSPTDVPVIGGLPGPDFVFQHGDQLVVYGLEREIEKFTAL
jgi:K+/H+ antiporter YhaU regulatory subunit KhtT